MIPYPILHQRLCLALRHMHGQGASASAKAVYQAVFNLWLEANCPLDMAVCRREIARVGSVSKPHTLAAALAELAHKGYLNYQPGKGNRPSFVQFIWSPSVLGNTNQRAESGMYESTQRAESGMLNVPNPARTTESERAESGMLEIPERAELGTLENATPYSSNIYSIKGSSSYRVHAHTHEGQGKATGLPEDKMQSAKNAQAQGSTPTVEAKPSAPTPQVAPPPPPPPAAAPRSRPQVVPDPCPDLRFAETGYAADFEGWHKACRDIYATSIYARGRVPVDVEHYARAVWNKHMTSAQRRNNWPLVFLKFIETDAHAQQIVTLTNASPEDLTQALTAHAHRASAFSQPQGFIDHFEALRRNRAIINAGRIKLQFAPPSLG